MLYLMLGCVSVNVIINIYRLLTAISTAKIEYSTRYYNGRFKKRAFEYEKM